MSEHATRQLGGEAGTRTLFGQQSIPRLIGLGIVAAVTVLWAAMTQSFFPFLLFVVGGPVVIALTQDTHQGTPLDRMVRRARWRERRRHGVDRFVPYTETAWEAVAEAEAGAKRRERRTAQRDRFALRTMPDGAHGLGWLRSAPREVGITWQSGGPGAGSLTVAWEVGGQLRGMQSGQAVNDGAAAFGLFLASFAPAGKLVSRVQTITRVLPTDTAEHQAWVIDNLAADTPQALLESYDEVVRIAGSGSMTQRHFVVCTWHLTPDFMAVAENRGEGREGWRALMDEEIESVSMQLRQARYTSVQPLSARQVAAIMRHMQAPSIPMDAVGKADPHSFGVTSQDTDTAYVVTDESGQEWWHRTARLEGQYFASGPRTPLWHESLIRDGVSSIRTISFHHVLVSAAEARARSERDLTSDAAEQAARRRKGQVADSGLEVTSSAAAQRHADIAPGSQHHGDYWVGYVTVTTKSEAELVRESRLLEDVCSNVGIDRIVWMDSFQSAAAGTCWPLGRGIRETRASAGARVTGLLAGKRS